MQLKKYVTVVQRRILTADSSEAYIFPLLEPLFAIETHMTFEERLRVFNAALQLRVGFAACEVGSYLGASTCFLAAAASLRSGHVHAVDSWRNDAMPGEVVRDTWHDFIRNTEGFRPLITAYRGSARDFKDHMPPLDLLLLDGDHSQAGTLADLTDYVPKLAPGGVLLLHDYTYEPVTAAVREYFQARPIEDLGRTDSLQAFRVR